MRTDNATLASALNILSRDIESPDGVANACIAEAADRILELQEDYLRKFEQCEELKICNARLEEKISAICKILINETL
jgi:hypothetical protein